MPLKEDALRRNRVVDTASREGRTLSISETLPGPAGVGQPWRKTRLWARDLGGRGQVQERTTQTHVTSPLGGRGRKLVSKDTEVKVPVQVLRKPLEVQTQLFTADAEAQEVCWNAQRAGVKGSGHGFLQNS